MLFFFFDKAEIDREPDGFYNQNTNKQTVDAIKIPNPLP